MTDGGDDRCQPGVIADRVWTTHGSPLHNTTECAKGTVLPDLEIVADHDCAYRFAVGPSYAIIQQNHGVLLR